MTTKLLPRLVATGALAAGLSVASALTGLATSAHAATVTHAPGTRTVTLTPGSDLRQAASTLSYDEGICSSPWLYTYTACATQLQHCAQQNSTSTTQVVAVFYESGILSSCTRLA